MAPKRTPSAPVKPAAPATPSLAAREELGRVKVAFPPVKVWQPDGSLLLRPGRAVVLDDADKISTREAAKILGCEAEWVARLCDRGELIQGRDWTRTGRRGNYKIKRSSILKLREEVIS